MKYCPKCGRKLIGAEIGGRNRRQCPSETCGYVDWDNPTPVVAAIVELNEKVVLTRSKGWPEKWYGLVAGFLEKGETPEAGVLREVKEELGLEGEVADFVGYYSFTQRNQLILAFHVQAEGEIVLGEELESVKLVRPEEVRPWKLGTGPALKDWLTAKGFSK